VSLIGTLRRWWAEGIGGINALCNRAADLTAQSFKLVGFVGLRRMPARSYKRQRNQPGSV